MFVNKLEQEFLREFPNFKYEISDDFIGVFDGLFVPGYCRVWREHFDKLYSAGVPSSRREYMPDREPHDISDESISVTDGDFYTQEEWKFACPIFNNLIWRIAHKLYAEKFSILKNADTYKIYSVKTQMTPPGGGYHIWHAESTTREVCNRILAFMLYLNTVEEGGETEFLYQRRRVQAVEGRLVIWPAGFTHAHRGNPPLKEKKYIVTGWMEF